LGHHANASFQPFSISAFQLFLPMIDIAVLAQTWGYPIVVVGTALQGDVALLICGFLAHQGYLNVWLVWLVGTLSASAGDIIYFYLGWRYGNKVLNKLPGVAKMSLGWTRGYTDRHPVRVMLLMRYFYGVRMAMPIICGMSTIPFSRFIRYNVPTAAAWAAIFVWTGYAFGLAAKAFVGEVEKFEIILTLVLAAIGVAYAIIAKRVGKRYISEGKDKDHEP
jgi:membrane protein DedA with SNARE-associated domain